MASQLKNSSPLMMEPWTDSFSSYGDPCLGSDGTSQAPLMFPDLWPLEAGNAYAAPPLYPVSDDLSPPLGDVDMLDVAAAVPPPPPPPACLDPFAWQGGDVMATAPAQPLWSGDDAAAGFDMAAPPPPPPGVGSFHADSPAWQAAPRGGGYRAPQRTTPPAHQHQHPHHPRPAPPASRPLAAAAAPAVKRSHSGTPQAGTAPRRRSAGTARRASSSSSAAAAAPDRPPAGVASGDALPGALRGLVAMERGLRSANHEQQRLLSATYERWDRRHSSASA